MTNKEVIDKFKDYVDCTDTSYAMLHYVNENEVFDIGNDDFRAKIPVFKLQERWVYVDNIKLGYKKDNGMPTAYALAIEARFSQNIKIKKIKTKNLQKLTIGFKTLLKDRKMI